MSEINRKKTTRVAVLAIFAALAIVFVILYYLPISLFEDAAVDIAVKEIFVRLFVAGFILSLAYFYGYKSLVLPKRSGLKRALVVISPCFLVAVVNFPFFALVFKNARITRADLIPLVAINCVLIAVIEEVFFRGMLQEYFAERTREKRYSLILTVALTNAVFALWHLVNVFAGASVGATLLQVVYAFLVGSMLSFVMIETKNVWVCVAIHAVFDFGGAIPAIGTGVFQDAAFWISTISVGVAVGAYVVCRLFLRQKKMNNN